MIENKCTLIYYLQQDAIANNRVKIRPKLFGDEIWKYIVLYRRMDYYSSMSRKMKLFYIGPHLITKYLFHKYSMLCGYSIPIGKIGPGLSIAHIGTIVINGNTSVGKNLRIQEGVTIGATNGSDISPILGDNVFVGSGAKIIGEIQIADDVAIGANAVVVKSILEKGTTWGGVPAKKISDNNSHSNLALRLFTK